MATATVPAKRTKKTQKNKEIRMDTLRESDSNLMQTMMKDLQRLRKEDKLGIKKNGGHKNHNHGSNNGSNNLNGGGNRPQTGNNNGIIIKSKVRQQNSKMRTSKVKK
jgi:hypothetical protein